MEKTPPEYVIVLNRYFTPFAAALVGSGILLGQSVKQDRIYTLILLLFAVGFNMGSAYLVSRKPVWSLPVSRLRLVLNFSLNLAFFYLLGGLWGPIWLLFVLTPIAISLYGSRRETMIGSVVSAGALLLGYGLRGLSGPVGWGQALAHASFILFVAFFIFDIKSRMMAKSKIL